MPNIILLADLKPFGADASEKLEPIKAIDLGCIVNNWKMRTIRTGKKTKIE